MSKDVINSNMKLDWPHLSRQSSGAAVFQESTRMQTFGQTNLESGPYGDTLTLVESELRVDDFSPTKGHSNFTSNVDKVIPNHV